MRKGSAYPGACMRPMMALEEERPFERRGELFCVCAGSDVNNTLHELSIFRFITKYITLNGSLNINVNFKYRIYYSIIYKEDLQIDECF